MTDDASPSVTEGGADGARSGPPRKVWGELVLVGLVVVLAAVLLVDTGRIAVPGSSNTLGPRFFPYVVGGLLVVVAVGVGLLVLRGRAAESEDSEDVDTDAGTSWGAVGLIAVAFAAHALLINVVGWPLAVTAMFATVSKALGARGWLRPVAAGGIVSVVVWIVFVRGLNVALPGGVLLEMVTGG